MKSVRETFGARLKELRTERKLSQKEFAEALDVHVSYVHQMETGKVAFRAESLEKIARILGVYPFELIKPNNLEDSVQKPSELLMTFSKIIKEYESNIEYLIKAISTLKDEVESLKQKFEIRNIYSEEFDPSHSEINVLKS